MRDLILAVDPGATSTKLALFRGLRPVAHHVERHPEGTPEQRLLEQLPARTRAARAFLDHSGVARAELAAVVGRGGALQRVGSGTYVIDDAMLRDVQRGDLGQHPENLGAPLAKAIADAHGCPAFVVDPVSVEELEPVASLPRPGEPRPSLCDALQMRSAARRHASAVQRSVDELRLVVAHLASRTSLCAMRENRLVEVVTDAPPGAPSLDDDEVVRRAERGDGKAIILLDARAYQIARRVGELAVALGGEVDAVLLTGSAAHITAVVNGVCRRVEWIAPVFVYPGEDELSALAEGALRVLTGEEQPKRYG